MWAPERRVLAMSHCNIAIHLSNTVVSSPFSERKGSFLPYGLTFSYRRKGPTDVCLLQYEHEKVILLSDRHCAPCRCLQKIKEDNMSFGGLVTLHSVFKIIAPGF
jgi:hypothetical protein